MNTAINNDPLIREVLVLQANIMATFRTASTNCMTFDMLIKKMQTKTSL